MVPAGAGHELAFVLVRMRFLQFSVDKSTRVKTQVVKNIIHQGFEQMT